MRMTRAIKKIFCVVATMAIAGLWSMPAMAQVEDLVGRAETSVSGGLLVLVTYLLLWLLIGGVLVFMMLRQQRLQEEIDGLEERIDEILGTTGIDR